MERYEKYKDSGVEWIGEIPEGWEVKRFKYLFDMITEKTEEELPKIGLENIESESGKLLNSDTDFSGDGIHFMPGDILFGKLRPYLAKVYLSDFHGQAVGDFFIFRSKGEIVDSFGSKLILSKRFIQITNGSTFGSMKEVLSSSEMPNNEVETFSVKEPFPKYGEDDGEIVDAQELINHYVEQSAAARGQQSNLSFFAFTATPKYKTLAVFGYTDDQGRPSPFHLYSMRQAIEEGFIFDVLQNYTTYQLFFKLSKAIEEDPEINKKKAARAIGRFVSLHPHNLSQKTEVIIEHFRQLVAAKIGGRAKAMLVTSSRLNAKRYFEEFKRYIKEKGYEQEIKILVAFSGRVVDDNFPDGVTEPQLTGFGEKELPRVFDREEYKILIVADKYQTGFDQPLLHTMYVDKPLSGVKAVQTLSRLNRTAPGKEDTFILDFVNDRDTILDSFQPYYEVTTVSEEPDPNHLFDLKAKLDERQVYLQSEISALANVYFHPSTRMSAKTQSKLYRYIDPAVDRYNAIEEEDEKEEFKKSLRTWTNLYSFLAQIMPFREPDFEKFYAYAKLLQTKLPKRDLSETMKLTDEVALEYYRLQKIKDGSIDLTTGEEVALDGLLEAGIKRSKEEKAPLSEIIDVLNERFGMEFEEADRLFFEQIEAELVKDETLQTQARVNQLDTFKYAFEEMFIDKLIERMDQNQEIFEKVLEDQSFGALVKELMMKKVCARLNENSEQGT
jgi:type I restriction enzyme, R subunit